MSPAPPRPVMHPCADLPARRASRPPTAQRDTDRDAVGSEQHIGDASALQRQQAVECGRDPHGLLPRSLSFENPAACRKDGRAGRSTPAQAPTASTRKRLQLTAFQVSSDPLKRRGDPNFKVPHGGARDRRVLRRSEALRAVRACCGWTSQEACIGVEPTGDHDPHSVGHHQPIGKPPRRRGGEAASPGLRSSPRPHPWRGPPARRPKPHASGCVSPV